MRKFAIYSVCKCGNTYMYIIVYNESRMSMKFPSKIILNIVLFATFYRQCYILSVVSEGMHFLNEGARPISQLKIESLLSMYNNTLGSNSEFQAIRNEEKLQNASHKSCKFFYEIWRKVPFTLNPPLRPPPPPPIPASKCTWRLSPPLVRHSWRSHMCHGVFFNVRSSNKMCKW